MIELSTLIERAWPVFREAARMGRTLTYSELAGRVGPPLLRRAVHRQLLIPLSVACREVGLPDLSAMVVRKETGMPGGGWRGGEPGDDGPREWAEALSACWAHPWSERPDRRLLAVANRRFQSRGSTKESNERRVTAGANQRNQEVN